MISIETIIGSAQKINKQRTEQKNSNNQLEKNNVDTVSISKKVNTQLDNIQKDLKSIQTNITDSQIIGNAINELREESSNQNPDYSSVLNNYSDSNKQLVMNYLGKEEITEKLLNEKQNSLEKEQNMNIARLKKLQIETENIFASNLAASDKADQVIRTVETYFISGNMNAMNKLSTLNAEVVMRLTR